MKRWWILEYIRLPFAQGRFFSVDPWRLMQALRVMSKLPDPTITFFGGKDAYVEGKYTEWAFTLAKDCVVDGMAVMTGGGPGVMEAANCGALEGARQRADGKLWTLGVSVEGVDGNFKNQCAPLVIVPFFFMRKWLLMYYARAIVVFPGGIGTLDELFEVLNLIKMGKMRAVPIVLIDSHYWRLLLEWYAHAVEHDLIKSEDMRMMYVVDDMHQALQFLKDAIGRG